MITHNFNIVANQLIALPKLVEKNATDIVRKIGIAIGTAVIEATPVDTGYARANWQTKLRNPINNEIDSTNVQDAVEKVKSVSISFNLRDHAIWICNNVPYINALNNGHSKQAPAGFIENAVENVHAIVEKNKLI